MRAKAIQKVTIPRVLDGEHGLLFDGLEGLEVGLVDQHRRGNRLEVLEDICRSKRQNREGQVGERIQTELEQN